MASLPYNIATNVTHQGILSATAAFQDVAVGKRNMALVCSDPGFGKTLLAKRTLRNNGVPFHEFGITPSEHDLVRLMWAITSRAIQHQGRRIAVAIADDQDGIARRISILNHMKSMFGADRRRVTFPSSEALRNEEYRTSENEKDRAKYNPRIAPPSFDLDVRLLWLSNIDYADPAIIAALPHFDALVSKGLDPQRIPDDAEHDGRDVFLYSHWLATERNMLGSQGYSYEVARAAVEFYVTNIHRLIDIPPRRLSLVAKTIRDNPIPADREMRLALMLRPHDLRPKLNLPESWIPVLLWPPQPQRAVRRSDPAPKPEPRPNESLQQAPPDQSPQPQRQHWTEAVATFGGHASEPLAEVAEPVVVQVAQPVVEQAAEPVLQTVVEQVTEPVEQLVLRQTAEPVDQLIVEKVEGQGADQAREIDLWHVPLDPSRITLSIGERDKIAGENGLKKFRGPPARDDPDIESLRCEFFRRYSMLGRAIAKAETMKADNDRSFWRSTKHRTPAHIIGGDSPPDTPEPAVAESDVLEDPADATGAHVTDSTAAVEQETERDPLELPPDVAVNDDRQRATFLLNTPLPALGLRVAENGDEDSPQLTGEPASVAPVPAPSEGEPAQTIAVVQEGDRASATADGAVLAQVCHLVLVSPEGNHLLTADATSHSDTAVTEEREHLIGLLGTPVAKLDARADEVDGAQFAKLRGDDVDAAGCLRRQVLATLEAVRVRPGTS